MANPRSEWEPPGRSGSRDGSKRHGPCWCYIPPFRPASAGRTTDVSDHDYFWLAYQLSVCVGRSVGPSKHAGGRMLTTPTTHAPPPVCPQRGTSLIEVLVTLLILAFGLLGVAGLQSKMGLAEMESYARSQALLVLSDMAERL